MSTVPEDAQVIQWTTGEDAARLIYRFFNSEYTERTRGDGVMLEGIVGPNSLMVIYDPTEPRMLGMQSLTRNAGKSRGGALLHDCECTKLWTYKGVKHALVQAVNGEAGITKFGVESEIYPQSMPTGGECC